LTPKENKLQAKACRKITSIICLISALIIAFDVTAVLATSSDIVVVVGGSTPTIDGSIEDGEWDDASTTTFSVTNGTECTVYAKQDGVNLYVGFDIPDATYNSGDSCVIIFDVDHDGSTSLQTDDMWLRVSRGDAKEEFNVTIGGWFPTTVSHWTAKASSMADLWQSEYNITYSKLDITAGTNKTLGVMFLIVDKDIEWHEWPSTASISKPATWGDMTSNEYSWRGHLDTTPPTVSIASPENKTYSVTDVPLTLTVNETTSWIGYSLDGHKNLTISGNTTMVNLSEGVHTVTVYANDTTGNMGTSNTVYFTVDTTPPNIVILSPENKTYTTSSVPLNFTLEEATSWIGYSLDDQARVMITGNTTLSGLVDGSHSIIVYANDTVGNMGVSPKIFFSINTQQAEPFPTWIVAAILTVAGVGAALLIYFTRVKKTTVRKWRRCPRCGTLNLLTNDFCDNCGALLREGTRTY